MRRHEGLERQEFGLLKMQVIMAFLKVRDILSNKALFSPQARKIIRSTCYAQA